LTPLSHNAVDAPVQILVLAEVYARLGERNAALDRSLAGERDERLRREQLEERNAALERSLAVQRDERLRCEELEERNAALEDSLAAARDELAESRRALSGLLTRLEEMEDRVLLGVTAMEKRTLLGIKEAEERTLLGVEAMHASISHRITRRVLSDTAVTNASTATCTFARYTAAPPRNENITIMMTAAGSGQDSGLFIA